MRQSRLVQRDPLAREVAAPNAGAYAFGEAERRESQTLEQPAGDRFFSRRADRARSPRPRSRTPTVRRRTRRRLATREAADRPRRASISTVESSRRRATASAGAPCVRAGAGPEPSSQGRHPSRGPCRQAGRARPRCRPIVRSSSRPRRMSSAMNELRRRGPTLRSRSSTSVVVQRNVQTHGRRIAHYRSADRQ